MNYHEKQVLKQEREQKHVKQLQEMGYTKNSLQALRRIENRINWFNERACDDPTLTEEEHERELIKAHNGVKRLFNKDIIEGFFINQDPRGYALKIKDDTKCPITYTDMGGYKILAPDRGGL